MPSIFAQHPDLLRPDSSYTGLRMDYQAWESLDRRSPKSDEDEEVSYSLTPLSEEINGVFPPSGELYSSISADALHVRIAGATSLSFKPMLSFPTSSSFNSVPSSLTREQEQDFNSKASMMKGSISQDSSPPSHPHHTRSHSFIRGQAISLQSLKSQFTHHNNNNNNLPPAAPLSPTPSLRTINHIFASPSAKVKQLSPPLHLSPAGLPKLPKSSSARSAHRRRAQQPLTSPLQGSWRRVEGELRDSEESCQLATSSNSPSKRSNRHRCIANDSPASQGSISLESSTRDLRLGCAQKGSAFRGGRKFLERPKSEGDLLRQAMAKSKKASRDGEYGEEELARAGFEISSPSIILPALVDPISAERSFEAATPSSSSRSDRMGKESRRMGRHSLGFESILDDFYGALPSASEIAPASRNGSFCEGEAPKSFLEAREAEVDSPKKAEPSVAKRLRLGEYILGIPYDNVRMKLLMHRQELGSGHFGTVRKCKEICTGKVFACKTISKRSLKDESDVRNIQREVSLLKLVEGERGFAGMKGIFEDEEYVHIVMDLCRGGDLLDHIVAHGPLTEAQAARMCKSLIESLWTCHKMGIVHRDVKPENILLTKKGSADCDMKLADFGIATLVKKGKYLKKAIGTHEYMAPEVYRRCYDAKADVWSAGVVLYAVLSCIPPFWASSRHSLKESILYKDVSFRSTKWEGKSEECKDLITRMLNKDPQKRISSADILKHPWIRHNAQ